MAEDEKWRDQQDVSLVPGGGVLIVVGVVVSGGVVSGGAV